MADSATSVYGFVKPEVGASQDTWGDKYNAFLDDLDGILAALGTRTLGVGGAYVDFPGGFRVVWLGGVTTTSAAASLTFPDGGFANAVTTSVVPYVRDSTTAKIANAANLTATTVEVRAFDAAGSRVNADVGVIAVGRKP